MTPRDYFGLVVRTVGLLLLIGGLYYLLPTVLMMVSVGGMLYGIGFASLIGWALNVAVSLYLLRGARGLLDFCYPKTPPPTDAPRPHVKTGW